MNTIAQWEPGPLPVSKNLGWTRWGLLGVLGDFVLNYTKGCIVEIGLCESSIYLTWLAKKYGRKTFHCDIQLGIIINMKTVDGYFTDDATIFGGSSDDFFKETEIPPVALGFIDGDHTYEQVKKDFDNLFPLMVDDGYIFLHDTYPPQETWLGESQCGTVYKLRQELEKRKDLDCFTFTHSAMEVGMTMVRKKPKDLPYFRR